MTNNEINNEITNLNITNLILALARIQGVTPEALLNASHNDTAQLEYIEQFRNEIVKKLFNLLEKSEGGIVNE